MTRTDARALAFLSDEPGPGPETLHVDLTNTCNFDCTFCWHYSPLRAARPDPSWQRARLPTALALAAIQDASVLGTRRVLFSGGGEPLLHPDVYEVLGICHSLDLKTTLISNLSVADVARLRRCPPEKILANCSGATAETYQLVHPNQRPDAWGRFQTSVRELADVSQVTLVFVVTRQNLHEVAAILDLARGLGAVRVQYKLADLSGPLAALAATDADCAELRSQLPLLRKRAAELGVDTTLDAFERELLGARRGLDYVQSVGCYAGWYYARVAADGSVYACCKNVPIGSLRDTPFADIWRGTEYVEFRQRTRARDFSRWPNACRACGNISLNVRAAQLIARAAAIVHAEPPKQEEVSTSPKGRRGREEWLQPTG